MSGVGTDADDEVARDGSLFLSFAPITQRIVQLSADKRMLGWQRRLGRFGRSAMIYLTDWNACPVGCGMGMVFLKAVGSGRVFFFCESCEVAWGSYPTEASPAEESVPELLAPEGIALPSREDIEEAGISGRIVAEEREAGHEGRLWRLMAYTLIEAGEYKRALDILNEVIRTWHHPPSTAHALRAEALRRQEARPQSPT